MSESRSLQRIPHTGAPAEIAASLPEVSERQESAAACLARTDYYCMLGLCVVVLLVYAQLWMPGLILIKRDAFLFFPAIKQYIVDRLSTGHLPQWFPYEGLGRPFLGIPITGMFHPFTLLYMLVAPHDAYRLSVLITCVVGVNGMFWLGRTLGYSQIGSVGSALAFILSGYAFSLTENVVYLYSFCMLPLFCAILHRAFQQGGSWLAWGAIVWASVLLHGDIQTGYYYGFVVFAWTLVQQTNSYFRRGGYAVAIGALAGLLACVQLAPAWVVFSESNRMDSSVFYTDAVYWSTHPLRLLGMLIGPIGAEWGEAKVASVLYGSERVGTPGSGLLAETLYVGLVVAGLAWRGVRSRQDLRPLAILGGVALILALGKYGGLYEGFYRYVPLWSAFRYPEKLMSIVTFAFSLFAGGGLDSFRKGKNSTMLWFATGSLCLGLWLLSHTTQMQDTLALHVGVSRDMMQDLVSAFAESFLYGAAVMTCAGAIVWGISRESVSVKVGLIMLILASSLDLWRVNAQALLTGPAEAANFSPAFVQAIRNHSNADSFGRVRILPLHEPTLVAPEELAKRLDDRALTSVVRKQMLAVEHNASYRIESAQVYLPGFPTGATFLEDRPNLQLSARYNVGYFIGRSSRFEDARFRHSVIAWLHDYDLAVAKNPVPEKPRAYLSTHPEHVDSPIGITQLIRRKDFLNGEVDIIEGGEGGFPAAEGSEVSIEQYKEEEVVLRVEAKEPTVLILLDAFAPGWSANIEGGSDLQIFRANGLVRAVLVPAGRFIVLFSYETPLLQVGIWMTFVGICIGSFLIAKEWKSKRIQSNQNVSKSDQEPIQA